MPPGANLAPDFLATLYAIAADCAGDFPAWRSALKLALKAAFEGLFTSGIIPLLIHVN